MSNYRVLTIVAVIFAWTISFTASSAQSSRSAGGTITFSGAIVDSPCDMSVSEQTMIMSCYRDGQTMTGKQVLSRNMPLTARLPGNVAVSQMQWLNPQRNMGVLTVSYL